MSHTYLLSEQVSLFLVSSIGPDQKDPVLEDLDPETLGEKPEKWDLNNRHHNQVSFRCSYPKVRIPQKNSVGFSINRPSRLFMFWQVPILAVGERDR